MGRARIVGGAQGNLPMTIEAVAAAKAALVVTEAKVSAVKALETKLAGKPPTGAARRAELSRAGKAAGGWFGRMRERVTWGMTMWCWKMIRT